MVDWRGLHLKDVSDHLARWLTSSLRKTRFSYFHTLNQYSSPPTFHISCFTFHVAVVEALFNETLRSRNTWGFYCNCLSLQTDFDFRKKECDLHETFKILHILTDECRCRSYSMSNSGKQCPHISLYAQEHMVKIHKFCGWCINCNSECFRWQEAGRQASLLGPGGPSMFESPLGWWALAAELAGVSVELQTSLWLGLIKPRPKP